MLRRSLRQHPRLWLLMLAPAFVAVETACSEPLHSSHQVKISREEAIKLLRRGEKVSAIYANAQGLNVKALISLRARFALDTSVYGNYKGSVTLTPQRIRGLGGFTKGTFKAGLRGTDVSVNSSRARTAGTVLVSFSAPGAGSLCVHVSWTTDENEQKLKGAFEFLGGSGRAARLHDKGTLLGVQPTPFVPKGQLGLLGTPSLGALRSIPRGCGSITRPPPPKPVNAKLMFKGFAASAGAPGAGAKLYADQATVTDRALCSQGGGLYAVFGYSGPASGIYLDIGIFSDSSTVTRHVDMRPGTNPVLIASKPKNGGYSFKAVLMAKSGAAVPGNTFATGGAQVAAGC